MSVVSLYPKILEYIKALAKRKKYCVTNIHLAKYTEGKSLVRNREISDHFALENVYGTSSSKYEQNAKQRSFASLV